MRLPSGENERQPALVHRQLLRQSARHRHGKQSAEPIVECVLPREEDDFLAVRRPRDDLVVEPHALRHRLDVGEKRQLARLAARRRHHIHVGISVVLPREGDPLSIRREFCKQLEPGTCRQALRRAAGRRHQPQIARIAEDDLVSVHVGKPHQPAFRHRLRHHRRRKSKHTRHQPHSDSFHMDFTPPDLN